MPTDARTVVVVGGGVMGAAAAWQLARRGHRVTVFEQFAHGHDRGSSHGNARIFRLAYPDRAWVDLARSSLASWRELEEESGRVLLRQPGALDHGDPGLVHPIATALDDAGVAHEWLSPDEATTRWPGLRLETPALFHPDGGTTDAQATVTALLGCAIDRGAQVHHGQRVRDVEVRSDDAVVHRTHGRPRVADRVVLTAGPWTSRLLAGRVDVPPMTVTREQPAIFAPTRPVDWPSVIHHGDSPAVVGGLDESIRGYVVPTPDGLVKVGEHHTGVVVDPDDPPHGPEPARSARVRDYVRTWLPGLDAEPVRTETCLYTTTDSSDFVIDRVGPVVVAAGFSGHGFKFAPLVGKVLADLVEGGPGLRRFRLRG